MRNKNGIADSIDWILSIGLFLMAITFIFVLFRPGVTPVHDSETLLDILQDGFEENLYWEVTKTPLFLAPIYRDYYEDTGTVVLNDDGYDIGGSGSLSNNHYEKLSSLIGDIGEQNVKLFYVIRSVDGEVEDFPLEDYYIPTDGSSDEIGDYCERDPSTYLGSESEIEFHEDFCDEDTDHPGEIVFERARNGLEHYSDTASGPSSEIERENELQFKIENEILIVSAYLDEEKTKYILTVSSEPINFNMEDSGEADYNGCYAYGSEFDSSPSETLPLEGLEEDDCQVVYELGATEKVSGIHFPSLLNLEEIRSEDCQSYDCIKEDWSFPASREFKIEVESIPESGGGGACDERTQLCFQFPENSPEAPSNLNIFVRQFNSFILTDDSVKIPVIVRILVW